jgi:ribosomal protein S12 methylthiotransferase accessory factor
MILEAAVTYPSGTSMRAQAKDLVVEVGPPPHRGGDPDAYGPFDLLLCALATCTGFPVMDFLRERGIPTEGAAVRIKAVRGEESHILEKVDIEIVVPPEFPDKYREALVRAAGLCFIKEQLGKAPEFTTTIVSG